MKRKMQTFVAVIIILACLYLLGLGFLRRNWDLVFLAAIGMMPWIGALIEARGEQ